MRDLVHQRVSLPAAALAIVLAAAALPVHAGPAAQQVQAEIAPTPGAIDVAALDASVRRHMETPGAVGLSVAVARGAELVFSKGYGLADLEFRAPVDEDTMFRIGSVTKQFTAAAIERLQERGKLAVDDDLTKYVPEFPTQGRAVTLREILSHVSGIPNYTDFGRLWLDKTPLELDDEQMLALIESRPFDFEPGTRWSYSNSGYYLLGMVVERVSGMEYGDFLRLELLEPLGLSRTRYDSSAEVLPNRAQGYAFEDGRFQNDAPLGMSQPGAAGGLISTARDLVRWQHALVSGRAVKPASYEEMTTPFMLEDGQETSYGFGLGLRDLDGRRCISHGGGIFGFNSWLGYFPEQELSVAVISNSEGLASQAVVGDLLRILLGE